jgi:hypothetical protein
MLNVIINIFVILQGMLFHTSLSLDLMVNIIVVAAAFVFKLKPQENNSTSTILYK